MTDAAANQEPGDATQASPLRIVRALTRWAASSVRYAADLALPPLCIACRKPLDTHGVLCPPCWSGIEFIRPPVCARLGTPLPFAAADEALSSAALSDPPLFRKARAAAVFSGVMRQLIHDLKYHDRHESVAFLAKLLRDAGSGLLAGADVIVPVPLSRLRLISRRFNQSAVLARRLSAMSRLPFAPQALIRTRHTGPQVSRTLERRRENVSGAFAVPARKAHLIRGCQVLLVDDVITTGATANACAKALLASGAKSVDVLALALVPDPQKIDAA